MPTGSTITLYASANLGGDGKPITYDWSVVSAPPASSLKVLSDPTIASPQYITDVEGEFVFSLIVSDDVYSSALLYSWNTALGSPDSTVTEISDTTSADTTFTLIWNFDEASNPAEYIQNSLARQIMVL